MARIDCFSTKKNCHPCSDAHETFAPSAAPIGQMNSNIGKTAAGNLDALNEAAMAIKASNPLLGQENKIEQFFAQAGESLRGMTSGKM